MATVSRPCNDKCVPLHRFSPQDICDCIKQWVLKDMNHKTHLAKTKQIFTKQTLSGQRMVSIEVTDHIKQIVKNDLLSIMTEHTLDIMFNCYDQWKNEVQPPYEQITSQSAYQMAHTLFHYPINSLLQRINKEHIDGLQLIQLLTTQHHNLNAFDIIIAEETGWDTDEVR
eukprot:925479_1